MPAYFSSGTVVFRTWGATGGLTEMERTFSTLDELFHLCVHPDGRDVVDHIRIDGVDERGMPRTLMFDYESTRGEEG